MDHTAKLGGGEIALLNLVSALDRERFRPVVMLASDGPLVGKLRAAGVETRVSPLDAAVLDTRKDALGVRSLMRFSSAWACLRYSFHLAGEARCLGADLIHTNSLKSDLYGGLAGRLAGIPVLWHVRDSIDADYLPAPVAAGFRALCRVLPSAVVANSESTLRTLRLPRRRVHAAVYSGVAPDAGPPAARAATLAWDGSAAGTQEADGESGPSPQVVRDGLDPAAFEGTAAPPGQAPELPLGASRRPVLALVGRITEWKGQHVFIEAAALARRQFPEARFQIIGAPLFGEHDYERRVVALAEALGLASRVEFLGFRDDVPALLRDVDIVVHASTLGEPFGQVVIEGMAAGRPVIATNGGALPEIVLPGVTGLLVPMGDAPALAVAMMRLLGDPECAAAMGAAGQRRVQEMFTIGHTLRSLERVYASLLDHRAGRRRVKKRVAEAEGA